MRFLSSAAEVESPAQQDGEKEDRKNAKDRSRRGDFDIEHRRGRPPCRIDNVP